MNKSKSIQDKGWKMVFGKFRSESIPEYEARMAVEQSNPNSRGKTKCKVVNCNNGTTQEDGICLECKPKTEDKCCDAQIFGKETHTIGCEFEEHTKHTFDSKGLCWCGKTEDTGECECVECEIQGLDKCRVCREWGGHRYTPEVKTQQGWEDRFDEIVHLYTERDMLLVNVESRILMQQSNERQRLLKQFISQEIETSKRELIEQIEKLPIVLVDTRFNPNDPEKLEQAVLLRDIDEFIGELK